MAEHTQQGIVIVLHGPPGCRQSCTTWYGQSDRTAERHLGGSSNLLETAHEGNLLEVAVAHLHLMLPPDGVPRQHRHAVRESHRLRVSRLRATARLKDCTAHVIAIVKGLHGLARLGAGTHAAIASTALQVLRILVDQLLRTRHLTNQRDRDDLHGGAGMLLHAGMGANHVPRPPAERQKLAQKEVAIGFRPIIFVHKGDRFAVAVRHVRSARAVAGLARSRCEVEVLVSMQSDHLRPEVWIVDVHLGGRIRHERGLGERRPTLRVDGDHLGVLLQNLVDIGLAEGVAKLFRPSFPLFLEEIIGTVLEQGLRLLAVHFLDVRATVAGDVLLEGIQHGLVQSQLQIRSLEHLHLVGAVGDQTVDLHGLLLADTVTTGLGLNVVLRVPV